MGMMKFTISDKYIYLKEDILSVPFLFDAATEVLGNARNVVKVMNIGGIRCNVKKFKRPNLINQFAYAYVRKSKAERSYLNANFLINHGILTPEPIAYIVYQNLYGVTDSYFISLQLDFDFEFRALWKDWPKDIEEILKAFTQFTYDFQQKGIFFKDHSQGNTLIKRRLAGGYDFYLVDLNRISFRKLGRKEGILNFSRLALKGKYLDIVAKEYARLTNDNYEYVRGILLSRLHS